MAVVLSRKSGGGGGSGSGVTSLAKSGDAALTGAVTLSEGSNVTLTQVGQDIEIAAAGGGLFDAYAQVSNTLAANNAAGDSTSGSFLTYPLNTEDFDTGSILSVEESVVTIEAATYYVDGYLSIFVPGANCKAKLRNTSDSTDLIIGNAMYSGASAPNQQVNCMVRGRITLAAQKTLELQYRVQTSTATEGLGTPNNFGVVEVYAQLTFFREA